MNRAIFLDRDGTINKDIGFCCRPEDFELLPGVGKAIKILSNLRFKVIVITNQSGIARGYFSAEMLDSIHKKMRKDLFAEDAVIDAIYYCPHLPDDGCQCHKPKPGLAIQAIKEHDIDPHKCYVIGDTGSDVAIARFLGCPAINVGGERVFRGSEQRADFSVPDLLRAANIIRN